AGQAGSAALSRAPRPADDMLRRDKVLRDGSSCRGVTAAHHLNRIGRVVPWPRAVEEEVIARNKSRRRSRYIVWSSSKRASSESSVTKPARELTAYRRDKRASARQTVVGVNGSWCSARSAGQVSRPATDVRSVECSICTARVEAADTRSGRVLHGR